MKINTFTTKFKITSLALGTSDSVYITIVKEEEKIPASNPKPYFIYVDGEDAKVTNAKITTPVLYTQASSGTTFPPINPNNITTNPATPAYTFTSSSGTGMTSVANTISSNIISSGYTWNYIKNPLSIQFVIYKDPTMQPEVKLLSATPEDKDYQDLFRPYVKQIQKKALGDTFSITELMEEHMPTTNSDQA